jgi:hypothetical protein
MKSIGLAFALIVIGIAQVEADSTIDLTNHQAWAANFGFTDWRPSSTDGLNIGPNFCSGFIYAANVGWIKMGTGAPTNSPSYSNSSASDFGVNCSAGATGEKNLRGFAYGANIGWVNFESTGNPRVILSTGQLRGYVWSANCGWINLDDANVFVGTSPAPSPTPSATPTATATATPNPTASATVTPNPTATPTPQATATPAATATPLPSATPTATPASPSRLANISTRVRVEAGDNVLIAGFIVEGSGSKRVILRAIGPSLAGFGIVDPLQDPTLELKDNAGVLIAANDDWAGNPNATEIMASGLAPTNPYESALLLSLAPGSYTAVLRGKNISTGIGLVEVYGLDADAATNIANISTRGLVLTGQDMMIGGFIITGTDPAQLVIRAIGPSLGKFGVPAPLADPFLEIHDSNGVTIQTNDNWRDTQQPALSATGLAPSDDAESALLISVAPGNYTAIVKGADGSTGNGLVEVYKLSP